MTDLRFSLRRILVLYITNVFRDLFEAEAYIGTIVPGTYLFSDFSDVIHLDTTAFYNPRSSRITDYTTHHWSNRHKVRRFVDCE